MREIHIYSVCIRIHKFILSLMAKSVRYQIYAAYELSVTSSERNGYGMSMSLLKLGSDVCESKTLFRLIQFRTPQRGKRPPAHGRIA